MEENTVVHRLSTYTVSFSFFISYTSSVLYWHGYSNSTPPAPTRVHRLDYTRLARLRDQSRERVATLPTTTAGDTLTNLKDDDVFSWADVQVADGRAVVVVDCCCWLTLRIQRTAKSFYKFECIRRQGYHRF
jgi:hypothetical protein